MQTTTTATRPQVQEMVVVHRAFRREYRLLPELVRGVAEGDRARAEIVARHVDLALAGLEMHHTGEDEVLWPLLLRRAAPSTGLLETMQAQHAGVEHGAGRIVDRLAAWRTAPTSAGSDELSELLECFHEALVEHLDLEEREVLPLVSRHVTPEEWARVGQHGREVMTPAQLPLLFWSVLEDADQLERRMMLAPLPLPIRLLLLTFGRWQYRRYVDALRGR